MPKRNKTGITPARSTRVTVSNPTATAPSAHSAATARPQRSTKKRVPSFIPADYLDAVTASACFATDGLQVYHWKDGHWQAQAEHVAIAAVGEWIRTTKDAKGRARYSADDLTPRKLTDGYKIALALGPKLPAEGADLDIIPCRNGYVHIEDDKLSFKPADPRYGMKYSLKCDYDSDAPAPVLFTRFIERVLPDAEVRARVQEYVGYTLTRDARHQIALVLIGEGRNGKGVFVRIVQALHRAVASVLLDSLEGFMLECLVGASIITVDELPRDRINEQLLKTLIAGEAMNINRKYQKALANVVINGKWILCGNHVPAFRDHSDGGWRRYEMVPFSVQIPKAEVDPMLAQTIIDTELGGVLNWALEGLMRLRRRGCFDPKLPDPMARLIGEAKTETNSVLAWVEDVEVAVCTGAMADKAQAYARYSVFCSNNGLKAVAVNRFWIEMRRAFRDMKEERITPSGGGARIRVCNLVFGADAANELERKKVEADKARALEHSPELALMSLPSALH